MLRSVASKVMWVGRARGFVVGLSVMVALVWSKQAEAAFPGTNGRIVFQSDRDVSHPRDFSEIYTMNGNGSDQRRITFTPRAHEQNPAFSSDGTKIAFTKVVRDRISRQFRDADMWTMNADGTGVRKLADAGTHLPGPPAAPG